MLLHRLTILATALLMGCFVGLEPLVDDTGPGGDGGDGGDGDRVELSDLDPHWAPLAGGTAVTVSGTGFTGDVRFWFGNSEVEVSVIDPQNLVVSTPQVNVEATVDVKLSSDWGEVLLEDAFTFSNTEPDDPLPGDDGGSGDEGDEGSGGSGGSGSSGSGGTGGATGLYGGVASFDYLVVGCPSCFGFAGQLSVDGTAWFHSGTSTDILDWLPAVGTCVVDPAKRDLGSFSTTDVGEHVYLESGSSSLDLRRQTQAGTTFYSTVGLGQTDYVKNAAYDLSVGDGGSLGAFDVEGAVLTTSGFDSVTPVNMLNDTPSAFPTMRANNMAFTWAPSGVSTYVVIDLVIFNPSGSAVLGEVFCLDADAGSFVVPQSYLSAYPTNALMAVYLYRMELEESVRETDGATIVGMSTFGMLGSGTLR